MTTSQKATIISALLTAGLFVAGITVLFGVGWGLLSASLPTGMFTLLLLTGMKK